MAKEQLKLMVEPELLEQLRVAAVRHKLKSANMLAIEILERYLPLWEQSADAQNRMIQEQSNVARGMTPVVPTYHLHDEKAKSQDSESEETTRKKNASF